MILTVWFCGCFVLLQRLSLSYSLVLICFSIVQSLVLLNDTVEVFGDVVFHMSMLGHKKKTKNDMTPQVVAWCMIYWGEKKTTHTQKISKLN